jgi:hypothetical protein
MISLDRGARRVATSAFQLDAIPCICVHCDRMEEDGDKGLRADFSFSSAGNVRQQALSQATKQKCQTHHGAYVAFAGVEGE